MENPSPTNLMKPAAVAARTTLDRVTIWRMVKAGTFPRPYKLSVGRVAWSEREVEEYIASCRPASTSSGALH